MKARASFTFAALAPLLWACSQTSKISEHSEEPSKQVSLSQPASSQNLLTTTSKSDSSENVQGFPTCAVSVASIGIDKLLTEALARNPNVRAAFERAKASSMRPSQEGSLPDPMIGFMSNNMKNPIPLTNIGDDPQSNAGLKISQEIPFPGKLDLQEKIASRESKAEEQKALSEAIDVLTKLKIAFADLLFTNHSLELLEEAKTVLHEISLVAKAKYEVGEGEQQDIIKANVEEKAADAKILALSQKKESLIARINAFLDQDASCPLGKLEEPSQKILSRSLDDLEKLAHENNPSVAESKERIEKNRLALDLAHKDYFPDLFIGGYYGNSGNNPDMWQLEVGFKVPAYFLSKQDYVVKEKVHDLNGAHEEHRSAIREASYSLKDLFLQAKSSEKLMSLYQDQIIPQSSLAFSSAMQSYRTGKVDLTTLLGNELMVVNAKLSYHEELNNYEKAIIGIEAIIAEPLR